MILAVARSAIKRLTSRRRTTRVTAPSMRRTCGQEGAGAGDGAPEPMDHAAHAAMTVVSFLVLAVGVVIAGVFGHLTM